ncbi:T6SS immunity protein Tli4 family protein [Providencia burhodogranariea]|uniref:Tle cognate immunity protein 4 C-terminal domain-containing protein n=1 Tax=Providencia burhodogranariea DSM 19968 TaxID=1141662 RepID=K8X4A7_9GAMM|nr:T6SS immunity protein Tli4 family protein [Providencia burhodogranariea]EKT64492.1 hypothetical protein OOA_02732 [Providencia burhodogranariea DSM 19968]
MINTLFNESATYCLGRYTFEYPQALTQELSSITTIDEITIESKPIYPPAFKHRIELKETELINKRVSEASDAPFLKEVIRLDNGVIFDHNEDYNKPDSARVLEAHIYINDVAFIITTKLKDLTKPKYSSRRIVYEKHNQPIFNKPQKLAAMKSLISRLQGRPKGEIPTTKGICIPNGFIADDGGKHKEKLSMLFKNNQFVWAIVLNNIVESENESLLERASEINRVMRQHGASTLKKGNLKYNDIFAEEWLISGEEKNSNDTLDKYYRFQYNVNEKNVTYLTPLIEILLHNSTRVVKDYSDDQMIEIWDRVLQSFKVRPHAF